MGRAHKRESVTGATGLMLLIALMGSGCASGSPVMLTSSVAVPYERSNAFSKIGYNEALVSQDRYRVTVGGRPATPKAYLQKIATVRAAEIGVEQRQGYFKIENMSVSEVCSPATQGGNKTGSTPEVRTTILTADVVYAKSPPDSTFAESKRTFEELRPTLDTEKVVPETPATPPAPCT